MQARRLTSVHVTRVGVAAVQLDVVHVPLGERESVQLQGAQHSRVARAREVAVVLVDPELQPLRVHLHNNHNLLLAKYLKPNDLPAVKKHV